MDDGEDRWSDAHETLDEDEEENYLARHPSGIEEFCSQATEEVLSASVELDTNPKGIRRKSPESPQTSSRPSNDVPVLQIDPSSSVPPSPTTSVPLNNQVDVATSGESPARTSNANSLSVDDHRARRTRTNPGNDNRASNRLSGFFSHLIHRRDPIATPSPASRLSESHTSGRSSPHQPESQLSKSRPASPPPTSRSTTPPPTLPPPTLGELGLSFSTLTSNLCPSHFTSPPWSGAFLGPHYLLLCHAQGLDVLPLVSPPAPQPYALVRRVSFKTVSVMEQRGVLVAIAGRRDGVRVYALEEIKKAIEWRMDVEVRRERDRSRREAKKGPPSEDLERRMKATLEFVGAPNHPSRKSSYSYPQPMSPTTPTSPMAIGIPKRKTSLPAAEIPPPFGHPPPYSSESEPQPRIPIPPIPPEPPISAARQARMRRPSVSEVLAGPPPGRRRSGSNDDIRRARDPDAKLKGEWGHDSSDDEAINVVAAASSGSQALDERTSALAAQTATLESSAPINGSIIQAELRPPVPHAQTSLASRTRRPTNLDLSLTRTNTATHVPGPPSPTPTLMTLRQTLSTSPPASAASVEPDTLMVDGEEEEEEEDAGVSLAQMLLESRLPNLPPVGTRRPQQPILLRDRGASPSPRTSDTHEDLRADPNAELSLAQLLLESRLPGLPPPGTRRPQSPILLSSSPTSIHRQRSSDEHLSDDLSLAQWLHESRLPGLPPPGSRVPQSPVLIDGTTASRIAPSSPTSGNHAARMSSDSRSLPSDTMVRRGRRRWSGIDGVFSNTLAQQNLAPPPPTPKAQRRRSSSIPPPTTLPPPIPPRAEGRPPVVRSQSHGPESFPSGSSSSLLRRATRGGNRVAPRPATPETPPVPELITTGLPNTRSRFIPRIISNALLSRRPEEKLQTTMSKSDSEGPKGSSLHVPPPKLEYVKLPGTKGALMVKSVETAKKSFLAILCGENGEKVELFAGTYRTALGLSRTFILPDSPRSLELQLQGDDLVELFLVFSQNVFGLEPATVRVREVRIGRAERRAARRRAREIRSGESTNDHDVSPADLDAADREEDSNVDVNIGISMAVQSEPVNGGETTPLLSSGHPAEHPSERSSDRPADLPREDSTNDGDSVSINAQAHADELVALATAHMGPYTTFQQLSFAPNFPLAAISDDYCIPPTYPDFLAYRSEYEPDTEGTVSGDLSQIQFSPPGLPVPTNAPPSKWLYRDPKGVVHGPWKASLMQAWYKDGLLPPDLPVRKEEDADYMLLKDLRLQCVDPTHPFRTPPPPMLLEHPAVTFPESKKPLLKPISLLSQPKHFGPPALFFSSRGGHSTAVVDGRGRSVLKDRFIWSSEPEKDSRQGHMGDIKRLEAFDVRNDRSVLVAMRQGGLEAVDLSDALLKPADESRTTLPQFVAPPSNINRRRPFIWRIGSPVFSTPTSSTVLSSKTKSTLLGGKKSASHKGEFWTNDDSESNEEVLYLGRNADDVYLCERKAGSFRILHLRPMS